MKFQVQGEVRVGSRVLFHGRKGTVEDEVVHLWPGMGGKDGPPGVNLLSGKSSVPHKSTVPEATSYFWTSLDL